MVTIRQGTPGDIQSALKLIKELAIYEKAGDQVEVTEESMMIDGFGPDPVFSFLVAGDKDEVVGLSLYYIRYSTWKGRRLYLEDLVVSEPFRGKGIGKMLFDETLQIAKQLNCSGMVWQVLDWNTEAIRFYEGYGADLDGEWINCSIPVK